MTLLIVKIGGKLISQEEEIKNVLDDIATLHKEYKIINVEKVPDNYNITLEYQIFVFVRFIKVSWKKEIIGLCSANIESERYI